MKRLFWSILAISAVIGVWFMARRRMDALYAEISRLRNIERKWNDMHTAMNEHEEKWKAEDEAYLASLSPAQRIEHELRAATVRSYLKKQLGDDYDKLTS